MTKICAENDFHIFVPSDLELWPLDLKFALLFTLVRCCVSTKLKVDTALLLRENRRHGARTDEWGATHNAALRESCIILSGLDVINKVGCLQGEEGPEIRGGTLDALIVQATTATKGKHRQTLRDTDRQRDICL